MIIDTEKIEELFDSAITGYKISQVTGINQATISQYRNKSADIENMSLGIAGQLMQFIELLEQEEIDRMELMKTKAVQIYEDLANYMNCDINDLFSVYKISKYLADIKVGKKTIRGRECFLLFLDDFKMIAYDIDTDTIYDESEEDVKITGFYEED